MIPDTYNELIEWLNERRRGITTAKSAFAFPGTTKIPNNSFIIFVSFTEWQELENELYKRKD